MKAKGKVIINKDFCKGCGYCIDVCPNNVLIAEKEFNQKGYFQALPRYMGKCTGCATCAVVCPEGAIEVYREQPDAKKRPGKLHSPKSKHRSPAG